MAGQGKGSWGRWSTDAAHVGEDGVQEGPELDGFAVGDEVARATHRRACGEGRREDGMRREERRRQLKNLVRDDRAALALRRQRGPTREESEGLLPIATDLG